MKQALLFIAIILILLLWLDIQPVHAQQGINYTGFFGSLAIGPSFGGAKGDLKDGMEASNLDPYVSSWFSTKAIKYPKTWSYPSYEIELGYYLKQKHWISAAYGINNDVLVKGYQNIGNGNPLSIRSKSRFLAANYHFHPGQEYPTMFIGPVLLFHTFENIESSEQHKKTIPGFNAGLSIRIINKEVWFLSLNTVYRWAPPQKAGPFSSSHITGIILEEPFVHTSTFKETNTSISAFVFLVSAGINIRRKKL